MTERLVSVLKLQLTFIGCLAVMFLLITYIVCPIKIDGKSMDPTLHDGDFGFSSILSLNTSELERFDVVIVKVDNEFWVKRVIALPNETVSCKNNVVYINGRPLDEKFLDKDYVKQEIDEHGYFTKDFDEVKVNEGQVFLMGDNRVHSLDSRIKGAFNLSDLMAKDIYVLWPFNHGRVVK